MFRGGWKVLSREKKVKDLVWPMLVNRKGRLSGVKNEDNLSRRNFKFLKVERGSIVHIAHIIDRIGEVQESRWRL